MTLMKNFINTIHCQSREHCYACRGDENFRKSIMSCFKWDGSCPFGVKISELTPKIKKNGFDTQARREPPVRVSQEEKKRRMSICSACPTEQFNLEAGQCRACGCLLKSKVNWVKNTCPHGHWSY